MFKMTLQEATAKFNPVKKSTGRIDKEFCLKSGTVITKVVQSTCTYYLNEDGSECFYTSDLDNHANVYVQPRQWGKQNKLAYQWEDIK